MRATVRFCLFIILLTNLSCEYVTESESISPVVATDLPPTCAFGETISFKVYHIAFNGCGEYSKHEVAEDGNVLTVRFYAKYPKTQGQICPDNVPTLETYYYYEANQKGDIYFRFFQDNYDGQEYLLDTLRVQ